MDEKIKMIEEANYYITPEYAQIGSSYIYLQGLISGRKQALEILRREPSQH